MTEQDENGDKVKPCPACGGTWPADRTTCLACGANLEPVPARPSSKAPKGEPLNWRWLDALAPEDEPEKAPEEEPSEKKWWQFWR